MIRKILNRLYDYIADEVLLRIQVGGHCGCCGAWVPDRLVLRGWPWTICDDCPEECEDDDSPGKWR